MQMFASAYSSNVILAKARAMYGNSLKTQNFADLLNCHSVSEVASYLKNHSSYTMVLSKINEATIHRGHLETLLRQKLFNDYAALGRYDLSVGMHMSKYLLQRGEIEQIMHCLRLMIADRTDEFFFSMPMYFANHTRLDLVKMSHVKNYSQLIDVMSGTPYQRILVLYTPKSDGRIRLTEIENALYTRLSNTMFEIIGHTSGELHKQLLELFAVQIDAQNVTRILRMKRFFNATPDQIRSNLLPFGNGISPKAMERMIVAATGDDVMKIFLSTRAGKQIPENQQQFEHDLYHRAPYYSARHHIHYSIHPMVVLMSYIILMDIELDDIVNIIEGIRYGLPPEEIKHMLVLTDH